MGVSGIGKPLKLRLFLEGQEVPVISATVSIGYNGPAVASVQILPIDEGLTFKPRTMVHLFFLDELPTDAEVQDLLSKGMSEPEILASYYKLFFAGEIFGFAFGQSPLSRSLVLQCVDFSSYWDACHATAIEYGPSGNLFSNQASVYGSNVSLFDDIVNFQAERIVGWLTSSPKTPGLENISGLAGGAIRMLEAIGGVPGHERGVNDFFTFAQLRCRVLEQITAEEKDRTAASIMRVNVFDQWLRQGLQNIGQQVTFRDMLKLLCQYIYYDVVPNPIAKYDRASDGSDEKTAVVQELKTHPLAAPVEAELRDMMSLLTETDQLTEKSIFNFGRDIVRRLKEVSKLLSGVNVKGASSVRSHVDSAANAIQSKVASDTLPLTDVVSAMARANIEIASAVKGLSVLPKVTYEAGVHSTATTARLRSQVLRPDCYFVAPPRCNVIFPEHFTQFSFDRNYMSEVTRTLTMVYNTLVGREYLLADKILAPANGIDMKKIQKQVGASGYTILMPHERHTGIIPRSDWLPNTASFGKNNQTRADQRGARLSWTDKATLFNFFKYRFAPRQAQVAGRFNPYLVCGFPALVILRPFHILPGMLETIGAAFSTEISDTSSPVLDLIRTNAASLGAPYQMLGMISSITHTIGQEGGTTNVSMHHARMHQGADDEFIGLFSSGTSTRQKRVRVPIVATNDLFNQVIRKGDVDVLGLLVKATPAAAQTGKAPATKIDTQKTRSVDVKSSIKSVNTDTGQVESTSLTNTVSQNSITTVWKDNPYVIRARIDKLARDVWVPNPPGSLIPGSKGRYGTVVGVEVVDPTLIQITAGAYTGKYVFRAILLHEDVDIKVDQPVPVEEIIRPSWFSELYSNSKIGQGIYMPFFGTTSLIDSLEFTGLAAEEITLPGDPEGEPVDPSTKTELLVQQLKANYANTAQLNIQSATDVLAYLYGLVKSKGQDVDKFIRNYASRPVATLVDILGSPDFEASYDGVGSPTITKGKAGFHSLAVHRTAIEKGNLTGLLQDPDKQLPRINGTGKRAPISPAYDVRKEKLERVDNYLQAIRSGFGLRG